MELTAEQIAFVQQDLQKKGITMTDLADNLVDHICCIIENGQESNFQEAYANSLTSFGVDGIQNLQIETIYLLTIKNQIIMKKTMFILGYIALFLSTMGILFKIQHWPGSSIMLILGIALLNFGFLPMFFYDRYKRAVESH
ncbi:MAG TPA: hypothetical protein VFM82_10130 [Flavobacteriaceae bacterium]|nr:hypothetical protein [Flavobacteriaceae bacterium]